MATRATEPFTFSLSLTTDGVISLAWQVRTLQDPASPMSGAEEPWPSGSPSASCHTLPDRCIHTALSHRQPRTCAPAHLVEHDEVGQLLLDLTPHSFALRHQPPPPSFETAPCPWPTSSCGTFRRPWRPSSWPPWTSAPQNGTARQANIATMQNPKPRSTKGDPYKGYLGG